MAKFIDNEGHGWEFDSENQKGLEYAKSSGMKEISDDEAKRLATQRASDDKFKEENGGLWGALKVGAGQFADEFFGGIPEAIYDKTASEEDIRQKEMLKELHPYVNVIAGVGGGITSLFTPIGFLGKVGKVATSAGRAVEGVTTASKLGKVAKGVAAGATEGAVMAAPSMAAELIESDPSTAGETLLLGSALGIAGKGFSVLGERAANAGKQYAQKQIAEKAVSPTGNYPLSDTLAQNADLKNVVGKTAEYGATGAGFKFGGPVGGFAVKEVLGPKINQAAQNLVPDALNEASKKISLTAGDYVVKQLDQIPKKLEALNSKGYSPSTVSSLLGSEVLRLNTRDEWKNHTESMNQLAASQPIQSDDPMETALNKQQIKVAQALVKFLPKVDYMDEPFVKNTAVPTPDDKKYYLAQVELAMNPFTIFDKANRGTLKKDDVKLVRDLYPNISMRFDDMIRDYGLSKNGQKMNRTKLEMINLLLQQDIDKGWSPEFVKLTQEQYQPAQQKDSGQAFDLPNSATETQMLNKG